MGDDTGHTLVRETVLRHPFTDPEHLRDQAYPPVLCPPNRPPLLKPRVT